MKLTNGLLGLGALLIASQANAATVSLVPSAVDVGVNDVFTLTVQGTDFINDVSSGSVTITWDPSVMQLTSTLGDISTSAALNGFPVDFGLNTLAPGFLDATFATFGFVSGPTFDFFSLDFVAGSTATAAPSTVGITTGFGGDWQDGLFPAGAITDVVYVDAAVNINAVPVPAAVWLFGSGLIGLVGVARRKA